MSRSLSRLKAGFAWGLRVSVKKIIIIGAFVLVVTGPVHPL
ncbi:hypothetical protein AmDm5_0125 [Acetobacter malorum]|nr:hypothetical protein AmDm5_0125 [Acetobacter malorum]